MMEQTDFCGILSTFCPTILVKYQEPMASHTSFRIGGPAQAMAFPKDEGELSALLALAAKEGWPVRILGAGTNVLAPDEGLTGLTVCLKDCLDGMKRVNDREIEVMAGVTMTRAAVFAAKNGLSGMEFAHGIPGTVGGGVYMNAGAYGGEIRQVCSQVTVLTRTGEKKVLSNDEMGFSYRHSALEDTGDIVLSARFALTPDSESAIRERMKELMAKRSASQPLDMPSAGSAFKRPVGGYAAALIDGAGLKGFAVGGAAISTKHAGFAVNLGGATAADVRGLLSQVSDRVFAQTGIRLEPEVRIW